MPSLFNSIDKIMQTKSQNAPAQQQLFGHPKGLFYLFFAELWERFSFYGMKALLVLYMTSHLLYSDKMSFGIFAAYTLANLLSGFVGYVWARLVVRRLFEPAQASVS